MIPAHPNHGHVVTFNLDLHPPKRPWVSLPVLAWNDEGAPLVAHGRGLAHPDTVTHLRAAAVIDWYIDEADDMHVASVAPGNGWMARYVEANGDTYDEPVLAWQIDPGGDGRAILLDSEGFVTEHDTRSLEGRDLPTYWHPEYRPLPAEVTQ